MNGNHNRANVSLPPCYTAAFNLTSSDINPASHAKRDRLVFATILWQRHHAGDRPLTLNEFFRLSRQWFTEPRFSQQMSVGARAELLDEWLTSDSTVFCRKPGYPLVHISMGPLFTGPRSAADFGWFTLVKDILTGQDYASNLIKDMELLKQRIEIGQESIRAARSFKVGQIEVGHLLFGKLSN
ncbi:hypothetical protein HKX48_003234 [Thoreauomyces humboldtii]|nr:hypothetical protein HKX48_003234 [Thoreauomyces humboldtii]